jgi:hypothetical protein
MIRLLVFGPAFTFGLLLACCDSALQRRSTALQSLYWPCSHINSIGCADHAHTASVPGIVRTARGELGVLGLLALLADDCDIKISGPDRRAVLVGLSMAGGQPLSATQHADAPGMVLRQARPS